MYWIIRTNKKDNKRKRWSTCSFDQVPKSSTWQILSWRPFPRKNGLPWNNRPSTWRARLSPHIHPHIWPSRCVSFVHVPPKGYWERTHLQMSKTEFYVMGNTKSGENGKKIVKNQFEKLFCLNVKLILNKHLVFPIPIKNFSRWDEKKLFSDSFPLALSLDSSSFH